MDQQQFEMFMKRFDTIESRSTEQHSTLTQLLEGHVILDDKVHTTVERHSTYFKLLFMGIPLVGTAIAKKMGWI
jgi:hypothetical protein